MPDEILSTCEVRWFGRGNPPADALERFLRGLDAEPTEEAPRTDFYLSLPADRKTGVKFREGKIEIKWLDATHDAAEGWVCGHLDCWRKLSLASEEAPWLKSSNWIAVKKKRSQLHWSFQAGQVALAPEGERSATRCAQEFAQVEIGRKKLWSICLEAVGIERLDCLNAMLAKLREDGFPEVVRGGRVCSYPDILGE